MNNIKIQEIVLAVSTKVNTNHENRDTNENSVASSPQVMSDNLDDKCQEQSTKRSNSSIQSFI